MRQFGIHIDAVLTCSLSGILVQSGQQNTLHVAERIVRERDKRGGRRLPDLRSFVDPIRKRWARFGFCPAGARMDFPKRARVAIGRGCSTEKASHFPFGDHDGVNALLKRSCVLPLPSAF